MNNFQKKQVKKNICREKEWCQQFASVYSVTMIHFTTFWELQIKNIQSNVGIFHLSIHISTIKYLHHSNLVIYDTIFK